MSFAVVAQSGNVVGQGIQPHISHMLRIKGNGNSPVKSSSGYAQILKARQQEIVHHLILSGNRLDELRMFVDILNQPGSVFAHTEEVGLLLGRLHLPAAVGALAVHQLRLGEEGLAGRAVKSFVIPLIDVSLVVEALENLLNLGLMVLVRGADKFVVGSIHQIPNPLNLRCGLVHKLLGRYASSLGLLLDFLAVLIGSGLEKYIPALGSLIAGNGIRQHDFIGVSNVGLAGSVGNGRGNIIWLFTILTHVSSLIFRASACQKQI